MRFWRLLPATLALLLAGAANPQHGRCFPTAKQVFAASAALRDMLFASL